jgi:pyruvate,water dikinase
MIERLTADTPATLERYGGKGCGLVRLMAAGFDVPAVWCLRADRADDPGQLDAELEALAQAHPDADFAVRSSATAEDLHEASFAGVYTTVLGVRGAAQLRDAVRTCCESVDTPAARDYRAARELSQDVRMAVLIQRMLRPETAGVLLTANPQRAFANEIVIDAAYGLGEGVVSGRADPDHLVLDRSSGEIRGQRIGEKRVALRHRGGGELDEQPVADADRERLCLDEPARQALFELATRVAEALGPRLDVEWAIESGKLHVLQARSITGLPPERPAEIHTRRFGDEYMADYTTPSSYTYLVRWIREYSFTDTARKLGRDDMLAMEPLLRHQGYVYMSGRYAIASMRSLPPASRLAALRDWYPPQWADRIQAEPFSLWLLLRSIVLPFRDPRGTMSKNVAALEAHASRIMREVRPRLDADYTVPSNQELATELEAIDELGYDHFRVIRWGMGQYAPMLHEALKGLLASWVRDESAELYQSLVSGLPGTHTAEINRNVWRLGCTAREYAGLTRGIREGEGTASLRARCPDREFWEAFDEFLTRHGHRSTTRDVAEPRWRETPDAILALIRVQLTGEEMLPDPAILEAASRERREAAWEEARTRLGRGPGAALRRWILGWICGRAQTFTVYRENQRYYLDVILCHLRFLVLEHGRRLARAGVLTNAWEAFLLEADELRALFASPEPSAELSRELEARRAHYDRWRERLPATFLYDGVETEGEVVEGDPSGEGGELSEAAGLGASRGVARGPLRVLRSVDDLDRSEAGDILVAENIDPGWTSVFPLLGGLVTETGGLLSHGALLAREYGIPAIMGVRDATRRFESGERVCIDGAEGTLEREQSRADEQP